jgi:hypothetical protein
MVLDLDRVLPWWEGSPATSRTSRHPSTSKIRKDQSGRSGTRGLFRIGWMFECHKKKNRTDSDSFVTSPHKTFFSSLVLANVKCVIFGTKHFSKDCICCRII